jgi:hypothetical protein
LARIDWHIERDGACTTVSRRLPARFDVSAEAEFPLAHPARLAQQIRQDMWRALRNVRGFSPVVRIERREGSLLVTAGGQASAPISGVIENRITELLNDAVRRKRWLKWAKIGKGT